MDERDVTAIVVNYNSGTHLRSCLEGLLEDSPRLARVIVVDNASTDESWKIAEEHGKGSSLVELVRSETNLGLAGGVNLALQRVDTTYVAVLNPDVRPLRGWLEPLVGLLDSDPTAAVACPLILMSENGLVNSAGQHVHVTGLGFNRGLGKAPDSVGTRPVEVDGLHGAAFVMRAGVLNELGGWDTTGFLYQEDVALSWDVLLAGQRIVFVPDSRVVHDYHLTMYPEKLYLLERNRWALLLSHLRPGRLVLLGFPLLISELLVWGLTFVRGPRFLAAKWRSWGWVVTQRSAISRWRGRVFARPVYDEDRLRRNTRWAYPISQLLGLGVERGESERVPPGGLPV